ncbi:MULTISPECIES: nucleotidyltransferase [Trichocoleus]|uniref:Nucleotidyltransferase n=1 Tax=Trichocoleus desertorum GB2-A4 TaxID=2933944 RepID=A0ABV0JFD2_9CYAN|nr:nucleotidyltransferase [Trichocoleus sp. FACHB-46]MBD1864554.1 nucleotidyltransferase [Trichocoleus sp. FACHB-46]
MPKTIDEGFKDFLSQLTPSPFESKAAQEHRASIVECLQKNFGALRFFRTGSFGNGTSIYGYSDVDYFACMRSGLLSQDSERALIQIRSALAQRFSGTIVRVDCPAIKILFGSNARESTEIVPAQHLETLETGYCIYAIPNCSNKWMRASPEIHDAYVRSVDQSLGGKVKPLIRFIKAWKYYRQVPISSFYIELSVAKYAEEEKYILYDIDIKRFLSHLYEKNLSAIQDPMGISGYIQPCSTQNQLLESLSKLSTALIRAQNALEAKNRGDIREAFSWWKLLYNEQFSSYYR